LHQVSPVGLISRKPARTARDIGHDSLSPKSGITHADFPCRCPHVDAVLWAGSFRQKLQIDHAQLGQSERAVRADSERTFEAPPGILQSIAIMTDTDNTRGRTAAGYGEIRLMPK